jgi:hypothetical protein
MIPKVADFSDETMQKTKDERAWPPAASLPAVLRS